MATLDQARVAKAKLLALVERVAGVQGVGITRVSEGYALKLNLAARVEPRLPAEVDGVPVIVEVVGRIAKR
jgi:hypothetical protein